MKTKSTFFLENVKVQHIIIIVAENKRKCYKCGIQDTYQKVLDQIIKNKQVSKANHVPFSMRLTTKEQAQIVSSQTRRKRENKVSFLTGIYFQNFIVDSGSTSQMTTSKQMFLVLEDTHTNTQVAKIIKK